jgi:hypothetical protein
LGNVSPPPPNREEVLIDVISGKSTKAKETRGKVEEKSKKEER